MNSRNLNIAAFTAGLSAVGWIAAGYALSHPLAFAMTLLIGAIAGAMLGGDRNVGAGAAMGTAIGASAGAGQSAQSTWAAQRRYDIAYQQCMVSKNNQPSQRYYYRQTAPVVVLPQAAPAPVQAAPSYPPAGYPPPPPGSPPPPPPSVQPPPLPQ